RATFAAVHRSQRLNPALGSWNGSLGARTQSTRKQPVDPFRRKVRQIAGDDQIPRQMCCRKSGSDSCQRSAAGGLCPMQGLRLIGYRAQAELRISSRKSNNRDFGDERLEQLGRVNDQWDAAKIEKSLVATHARAGAPRKNKSSDLAIALH